MKRIFLIVLDSCGVGYEPDADKFGDVGSDTLRRCATSSKFDMTNLVSMGLGNLDGIDYLPKCEKPTACAPRGCKRSAGWALPRPWRRTARRPPGRGTP